LPVCRICGKFVKDLRRHHARGRCRVKGRRRSKGVPAVLMPGTPENRLRQIEYGGGRGLD
jgi:hypothetical protein